MKAFQRKQFRYQASHGLLKTTGFFFWLFFLPATGLTLHLPVAGVWRGTIGSDSAMVCLRDTSIPASYYFIDHPESGIVLNPTVNPAWPDMRWEEGQSDGQRSLNGQSNLDGQSSAVMGIWVIDDASAKALKGTWSDVTGKTTMPIVLERVQAVKEGEGCGRAYHEPRFAKVQKTLENATANGHNYHVIRASFGTDDSTSGLHLPDSEPGAKVINAMADAWLDSRMIEIFEQFDQKFDNRIWSGASLEVLLWTTHWLVLEDISPEYMRGSDSQQRTFAMPAGLEINVGEEWIKPEALRRPSAEEGATTIGGPLDIRLYEQFRKARVPDGAQPTPDDDDCASQDTWNYASISALPEREGLAFWIEFGGAIRACSEKIVMPYDDVLPYATEAGKQAMTSLKQDLAAQANP